MPTPSRRAVLGAVATVPLAGCSALSSEPVRRDPGEAYETDDLAVTVSDLAVRNGMVTSGGVHPDPLWREGAQFLLATVAVEGEADPAELDVTATTDTLDGRPDRHFGFAPDALETAQPLGFAVPTDPAPSEAAVVWNGPREVRWPVPDPLVRRLGRAPAFSLAGFRVPETAPAGSAIEATVEVKNTGERDGRFLAEVGDAAMSDQPEIETRVPAGETATATRPVDVRPDAGEATVLLRWEGGVRRRTVSRE